MTDLSNYVPPSSIEAEQATLGAMLIERDAIDKAIAIVDRDDFYRLAHQTLFTVILGLHGKGQPVDLISVADELKRSRALDAMGGMSYLTALFESVPTAASVEHYARIVADKAHLRRMISVGLEIVAMARSEDADAHAVLQQADKALQEVASRRKTAGAMVRLRESIRLLADDMDERFLSTGYLRGLSTGFYALDRITNGLPPELILLGGRPSMGKSALAYALALNVCRAGQSVVLYSQDAGVAEVTERILQSESKTPSWPLKTGKMPQSDWDRVVGTYESISRHALIINDTMDITLSEMATQIKSVVRGTEPLGMIVIDYIQLLKQARSAGGKNDYGNRNAELSDISRGLKKLSRDFKVPVLALSQLSRDVERRENKRPVMSDLRDSGGLEAEAHQIWFVYRDAYYKKGAGEMDVVGPVEDPDPERIEEVEVGIAKNKNGATGFVRLGFQPAFARFMNFDTKKGPN